MKSRRVKRRQVKRTKRKGSGLFGPNKCGVLNEGKSLADNIRNCKKNKDKWNNLPFGTRKGATRGEGAYVYAGEINCDNESPEYTNYPSNPECINDIIQYPETHFR